MSTLNSWYQLLECYTEDLEAMSRFSRRLLGSTVWQGTDGGRGKKPTSLLPDETTVAFCRWPTVTKPHNQPRALALENTVIPHFLFRLSITTWFPNTTSVGPLSLSPHIFVFLATKEQDSASIWCRSIYLQRVLLLGKNHTCTHTQSCRLKCKEMLQL